MTGDAAFVDAQVSHQLGPNVPLRLDRAARAFAVRASAGGVLAWNAEAGAPHADCGWRTGPHGPEPGHRSVNREKHTRVLHGMQAAEADFGLMIDMQDRRVRSLMMPDGGAHPVVGFNRLPDAPGRILWPLPGYHDEGSPDFLGDIDPTAVPWQAKADRFAWRGIHGGRANPRGDIRAEGRRLAPILRDHASGDAGPRKTERLLQTFPRHRFVSRYHADPRGDVGFVDGNGFTLRDEPLLAHLERPRLPRTIMQHFRYLVVLRGLDIGSSFFWTMNSGSLGLVMETPFESFASCHFRAWEHYVPFREDLADFEERLDWARANGAECRAIVARAVAVCRLLARADLRDAALRGVVAGLRARLYRAAN